MIRLSLLTFLVLTLPRVALAASPVAGALPPGSTVFDSVAVSAREDAVVYRSDAVYVGVVSTTGHAQLTWHRRLPFAPSDLFLAGSYGAFSGIGSSPGSTDGEFFAFRIFAGKVHPAIQGDADGIRTAAEGVHLSHGDVLLRAHDTAHKGSVSYARLVRYRWDATRYVPIETTIRPDYPKGDLPTPRGVVKTSRGDTILIRLEVAGTEQARETGLMYRTQLDADSGMIFVWNAPILESFWMENTYIPLTVAFLAPDGTIQETQDMQPLTTDLHTPTQPYQYAIEANLGFFAANGIKAGDKVVLQLT